MNDDAGPELIRAQSCLSTDRQGQHGLGMPNIDIYRNRKLELAQSFQNDVGQRRLADIDCIWGSAYYQAPGLREDPERERATSVRARRIRRFNSPAKTAKD